MSKTTRKNAPVTSRSVKCEGSMDYPELPAERAVVELGVGAPLEMCRGVLSLCSVRGVEESYRPLSAGVAVREAVDALVAGVSVPKHRVIDANASLVVDVDRLVELKLNDFVAALLESVKVKSAHLDGEVVIPSVKLSFELTNSNS